MKFNKIGLTVLLCSTVYGFNAMSFETAARNAILMDYDTGEYLFTKNMDERTAGIYEQADDRVYFNEQNQRRDN